MSQESATMRAQLAAAKANLAATASARSERGKAVKAATNAKRLRATGREAVFSVRCRDDLPAKIKKLCVLQGISIGEWFEQLIDRELGGTT